MSEMPTAVVHPTMPIAVARLAGMGAKNRVQAALTGGGISILLARAIIISVGSRRVLKRWVIGLAVVELLLDGATLGTSIRWWMTNLQRHRRLPLRLAAAATLVHAVRVLIFVLGRLRPFKDLDVRPEHRAGHNRHWTWGQVWFAAAMSTLGVIGLVVIRKRVRRPEIWCI